MLLQVAVYRLTDWPLFHMSHDATTLCHASPNSLLLMTAWLLYCLSHDTTTPCHASLSSHLQIDRLVPLLHVTLTSGTNCILRPASSGCCLPAHPPSVCNMREPTLIPTHCPVSHGCRQSASPTSTTRNTASILLLLYCMQHMTDNTALTVLLLEAVNELAEVDASFEGGWDQSVR